MLEFGFDEDEFAANEKELNSVPNEDRNLPVRPEFDS